MPAITKPSRLSISLTRAGMMIEPTTISPARSESTPRTMYRAPALLPHGTTASTQT